VPKILVADDNTNIQKMVSLALEERGINVVSVGNGEAAVRRIPDVDPDLVLADIFMPVRNGYEVCEFVKKNERFAHVPVILLVGAFDPLDEKEARRVGADGVLKKPFVPPDPLIAMVTSALEKNPRVAAEAARAKEAKMPPEPEPLPSVELAARPEPKPLPEFPEPSPEETEIVYGMGKGNRSLESEDQQSQGVSPYASAPVEAPSDQFADDSEMDEASTASDWRRTAMDLEIPAELASKPAIPSFDDLEPISFPSEKDYPPRRVSKPEPVDEAQPVAQNESASGSQSFSIRQIEDSQPEAAETRAPSSSERTQAAQIAPEDVPAAEVHSASGLESQAEQLPEPNSTAFGGHWLDAVASAQATEPASARIEELSAQHPEPDTAPVHESKSADQPAGIAAEASKAPELEENASAAPEASEEAASYTTPPPQLHDQHNGQVEGQSFFADEPVSEPEAASVSEQHSQDASESSGSPSVAAGSDIEPDADESEPPLAFKDPALVEQPAVHVSAEPLLVQDEDSGTAQYGSAAEDTAPLYEFLNRSSQAPAPVPAPAAEAPAAAAEFSVQAGSEPTESSEGEVDERIPTMPPPNREALSHIPFLTPPPSFISETNSNESQPESRAADPETVDTVVQKVMEKLQPQLQELLSQGLLRPLVENLLQNELTKKK
jgi:CheY-like chemotaxis protein